MGKKVNIEAIVDGIKKGTSKFSSKEKNMTKNVARIDKNITGMYRGAIAKIWDNVMDLWKAVKDPEVPVGPKLVIIGALVYLVSPIDAIPDFIPVAGLTDDAGVLMLVFKQMSNLINEVKNRAVEAAAETAAIETKAHLRRLRISLIVSIVVAILAIIVFVVVRLTNTV